MRMFYAHLSGREYRAFSSNQLVPENHLVHTQKLLVRNAHVSGRKPKRYKNYSYEMHMCLEGNQNVFHTIDMAGDDRKRTGLAEPLSAGDCNQRNTGEGVVTNTLLCLIALLT